MVNNCKIYSWP